MKNGFTLLELLIAIMIAGFLSVIGYPSYQNYIQDANRQDSLLSLKRAESDLKEFYNQKGSYDIGNADLEKFKSTYSTKYHTIELSNMTSTTYTLTMTPLKSDKKCGTLIIENGAKSMSGGYSGDIYACFNT